GRWGRAGSRRGEGTLRRAAPGGAHREGRAQPPALPLSAREDARAHQTRGGQHPAAAGAALGADEARSAGGPGPPGRIAGQWRERGTRGGRCASEGRGHLNVVVLMEPGDPSRQALTLARKFGDPRSVRMDAIQPFAPDAIAAALARAADELNASAVFAAGTDRGNEVLARLAARTGLPFAANCIAATPGDPVEV